MELSQEIRERIVDISLTFLGVKRTDDFTCITFVREVYKSVGISVPIMARYMSPPQAYNSTYDGFLAWRTGDILFLKRKKYAGDRTWTHVGIMLPEEKFIHSSHYFDGEVSINTRQEILDFYHYAPS